MHPLRRLLTRLPAAALACPVALAPAAAIAFSPAGRQPAARAQGTPRVSVEVTAATLTGQALGAGRTRVRVRISHTPVPPGDPAARDAPATPGAPLPARWFVRTPGTRTFRLIATSPARELAPTVLAASAIVAPPAAVFDWRVCIAAPWPVADAHGVPARSAACPSADFTLPRAPAPLEYQGRSRGVALPAQPSAAEVAAAASFLAARQGRTALAVMDDRGRIAGLHVHEHFRSASVVKVMFLTAYLQRLEAHRLALRRTDERLLYPMIHFSDNNAASAVLRVVGLGAVARVAREAGMTDYAPGAGWWAFTQTSAIDQVRLFSMLGQLIPARFYGYARYLLSTIAPEHSWGIPPVARPRWQVFYKTGSLPSEGLFNEAALLERGPVAFAVAVFTDGDLSPAYGKATIEGVAARLLGQG